jgi:hypothetical protein
VEAAQRKREEVAQGAAEQRQREAAQANLVRAATRRLEELKKLNRSGAKEDQAGPLTRLETRDDRGQVVRFAGHERWTYELLEAEWRGPEWRRSMEYKPPLRPMRGEEEVLVGIQVEDGLRTERRVRADTSEKKLKYFMQGIHAVFVRANDRRASEKSKRSRERGPV